MFVLLILFSLSVGSIKEKNCILSFLYQTQSFIILPVINKLSRFFKRKGRETFALPFVFVMVIVVSRMKIDSGGGVCK